MPPVRRVEARADGLLIETAQVGILELTWVRVGNQVTFTFLRDGVQRRQQTINTPTAAQIETWIDESLNPVLEARFGVAVHVNALNPLSVSLTTVSAGVPILPTWWA